MDVRSKDKDDSPFISVIIPVYNNPEGIKTTIHSLVEQSYPTASREFLIVDNGSKDQTRDVIRQFTQEHDDIKLLLENEIQSSYAARNKGVRHAFGTILAFIDADMSADKDWLKTGAKRIKEDNCDYVAGSVEVYPTDKTVAAAYDQSMSFQLNENIDQYRYAQTCNLMVRQQIFDDLGLFDGRLISGGDLEFGHRVDGAGYNLCFAPKMQARHPTRTSLQALLKKYFRLGRGRQQVCRYHPERYGHPLHMVFTTRFWAPPLPWMIPQLCRDWEQLSMTEQMAIFMITYLLHLANLYGRLREFSLDIWTEFEGRQLQ